MNSWLKMAALALMFTTAAGGMAQSQEAARDSAVEKCWMQAHKEYPPDSGNDVNTSAFAKAAYAQYVSCMQSLGFKP